MRAKCLAQEHKTMTPAGSEPGLNSRYVIQSTGPPRLRFLLQANVCRYVGMYVCMIYEKTNGKFPGEHHVV